MKYVKSMSSSSQAKKVWAPLSLFGSQIKTDVKFTKKKKQWSPKN